MFLFIGFCIFINEVQWDMFAGIFAQTNVQCLAAISVSGEAVQHCSCAPSVVLSR